MSLVTEQLSHRAANAYVDALRRGIDPGSIEFHMTPHEYGALVADQGDRGELPRWFHGFPIVVGLYDDDPQRVNVPDAQGAIYDMLAERAEKGEPEDGFEPYTIVTVDPPASEPKGFDTAFLGVAAFIISLAALVAAVAL